MEFSFRATWVACAIACFSFEIELANAEPLLNDLLKPPSTQGTICPNGNCFPPGGIVPPTSPFQQPNFGCPGNVCPPRNFGGLPPGFPPGINPGLPPGFPPFGGGGGNPQFPPPNQGFGGIDPFEQGGDGFQENDGDGFDDNHDDDTQKNKEADDADSEPTPSPSPSPKSKPKRVPDPRKKRPKWPIGKRPAHSGLFGRINVNGRVNGCQYTRTYVETSTVSDEQPQIANVDGTCNLTTAAHCTQIADAGLTRGTVQFSLSDPQLGIVASQTGALRTNFFTAKVLSHPGYHTQRGIEGWPDIAVIQLPKQACQLLDRQKVPEFPICKQSELPKKATFRAVSFCMHQTDEMGRKVAKAIAVDVTRQGRFGYTVKNYGKAWKPGTSGGGLFYVRKGGEPCLISVASTSTLQDHNPVGSSGTDLAFLESIHKGLKPQVTSSETNVGYTSQAEIDVGKVIPPIYENDDSRPHALTKGGPPNDNRTHSSDSARRKED